MNFSSRIFFVMPLLFCTLFAMIGVTTIYYYIMDKNNKKVEQHDHKATHNSAMNQTAKSSQKNTASTKSADKGCGMDKKGSCATKKTHQQDESTGTC